MNEIIISQIRQRLEILYQMVDELERSGGGGEPGTTNYNDLTNKPSVNGHILIGSKTSSDLDLQPVISDLSTIRSGAALGATSVQPSVMEEALDDKANASTTYTKTEVDTALSGKQATLTTAQLAAANSGITSPDVAQITINKNNISYNQQNGVRNIIDIQHPSTNKDTSYTLLANGGVEISCNNATWTNYNKENIPCKTGKNYKFYFYTDELSGDSSAFNIYLRKDNAQGMNYFNFGINQTGTETRDVTATTDAFWLGIYLNNSPTRRSVSAKIRVMIVADDIADNSTYQPYAMSNVELTAAIQALQAQLANQ